MKLERRSFNFEVRAKSAGDRTITGYASVFNSMSEPLGCFGFREVVMPGAFAESLANTERDVYGLWNHDSNQPLASRTEGSLVLSEDATGLAFEMTLDDTTWGENAFKAIDRGRVRKMSFGFETLTEDWKLIDGEEVRQLIKVCLWEVSPVVWPAYTDTSAATRSAIDDLYTRHLAQAGAASAADKGALELLLALNTSKQRRIA